MRRSDGSIREAILTTAPIRPEDPSSGIVGIIQDITGRKEAERALHESERNYRELVENANSIILRWNSNGRITFLNDYGLRFFGYGAEELVGRHVVGTITPRPKAAVEIYSASSTKSAPTRRLSSRTSTRTCSVPGNVCGSPGRTE